MLRSHSGVNRRQEECEAITGTLDSASAWVAAASERWEMSTRMPTRFISVTSSWPNGDKPFHFGSSA